MLPPRVRQESGKQFVQRALQEQRQGNGFAFAVLPAGSPGVIGQIRLMNWAKAERRAEVGYWIQRKHWGKGYGTEALRLICAFAFKSLRVHRIEASVVDGNNRSAGSLGECWLPAGRKESTVGSSLSVVGWTRSSLDCFERNGRILLSVPGSPRESLAGDGAELPRKVRLRADTVDPAR